MLDESIETQEKDQSDDKVSGSVGRQKMIGEVGFILNYLNQSKKKGLKKKGEVYCSIVH